MGNIVQLGQVRNISEEILADVNLAIAKFNSGTVTFGSNNKSKDTYAYIASIEGFNFDKGNIIITTDGDKCSFTIKSSEELGYSIIHNSNGFSNTVMKFKSKEEFEALTAMDFLDVIARYCKMTHLDDSFDYLCQIAESVEPVIMANINCKDSMK